MAKLAGLFLLSLLLIGIGAYISTKPAMLEPYRRIITTSSTSSPQSESLTLNWRTYAGDTVDYRFKYPSSWQLQPDVPGCGPVWFASTTKKVWLTICGPYPEADSETLAKQALTDDVTLTQSQTMKLGNRSALRQDLAVESGASAQIYLDSVSTKTSPITTGTLIIFFTNLETENNADYNKDFETLLTTFLFD
jgi:hypothetical protein